MNVLICVCILLMRTSKTHSLSHYHVWSRLAQVFAQGQITRQSPFVIRSDGGSFLRGCGLCCQGTMASAEDVVDGGSAHVETLVQTQQAAIAAMTTVTQQQQSAADGGNILNCRSFSKLNRFDGAMDAWRDWAPALMSYIQTVSPVLKKGMEHAGTSDAWTVKDPNPVKDRDRLHHILILLNMGDGEGLEAWSLNMAFDPRAATGTAGSIMDLARHIVL